MEVESQNKLIKNYLENGNSITGLDALNKFGCMCLPRRICDIKETGFPVESQWIKTPSGKRIKEYWMSNDSNPENEKD